jgi:hypothetical protein
MQMNKVKFGEKFNKLTVIGKSTRKDSNRNTYYICKCDCGKECEIRGCFLRNGHTKSCGCLNSKEPGQVSWNKVFLDYKYKASKRRLSFHLSFEQFKELASLNCTYCGKEPRLFNTYVKNNSLPNREEVTKNMMDRSWIKFNGIDRIDNAKGYEKENCAPCCTMCNSFKTDYNKEEFLAQVNKIFNFQKGLA